MLFLLFLILSVGNAVAVLNSTGGRKRTSPQGFQAPREECVICKVSLVRSPLPGKGPGFQCLRRHVSRNRWNHPAQELCFFEIRWAFLAIGGTFATTGCTFLTTAVLSKQPAALSHYRRYFAYYQRYFPHHQRYFSPSRRYFRAGNGTFRTTNGTFHRTGGTFGLATVLSAPPTVLFTDPAVLSGEQRYFPHNQRHFPCYRRYLQQKSGTFANSTVLLLHFLQTKCTSYHANGTFAKPTVPSSLQTVLSKKPTKHL